MKNNLTRIGIFYDGNYLFHVSNYYQYHHARKSRISVSGVHSFVRYQVAQLEGVDISSCQIVDAHYFRGRLRAADAEEMDLLRKERVFDDVLQRENVTTHYLPLSRDGEKGIDVWLALEAFDLAKANRFDVLALVACDGDFQPLLRKLNATGCRCMVLGWDFRYVDRSGNERETRTAQVLLNEASYPVQVADIIDQKTKNEDLARFVNNLFVPRKEISYVPTGNGFGTVQAIKTGYGFIRASDGTGLFFHYSDVNGDFTALQEGMRVQYDLGENDRGPCAKNVRVAEDMEEE